MNKHLFISDRLYRVVIFTAAVFILIAGMMQAESFITLILISVFISVIGVHPVHWLDQRKVPHGLSVVIVLLGMLLVVFGLSGIIGGSVSGFTAHLDKYETRLIEIQQSLNLALNHYGLDLSMDSINQVFDPGKILDFTASTLGQLGNVMSNATLVIFIVLFILLEMNSISYKAKILGSTEGKTVTYLSRIEKSVRHYLVIKTIVSILTGLLIGVLLWIFGVEYAILWGLVAFLMNYIPNIGSIIAAVPAFLFAWIQLGFGGALWVLGIYAVVNLFVGYVVEPRALGRGMGLSTLVVFLSLILWGYIFGIVGMFLSVPLTMIFKIIFEQSESTRSLAAMLGTDEDAKKLLEE